MDSATLQKIKEKVSNLPLKPGCYMFLNKEGEVIYVGKAKKLKNRVSSYFVDNKDHSAKVKVMVRQIHDLKYHIVDSETDALLLENSLIKNHQPKYNILLKDDKTYPWIVITNDRFPRVLSTRQVVRDGSKYFGPYGSTFIQRTILDFIREVIPLRTCRLDLSEDKIEKGKYSSCLQYHLGNCKAPCIGQISSEEYKQYTELVQSILKGDLRPVKDYLEREMNAAASELRFETAQHYKSRLDSLEKYRSHSVIVSASIEDADVFSIITEDGDFLCNFMRVRGGSITAIQTFYLYEGIDDDPEQMLTLAIQHVRDNITGDLSKYVIVPYLPHEDLFENTCFIVPQRGEKRDLLDFSLRSARIFRSEQIKNMKIHNPERHTDRLMAAMQRELRLDKAPRHIECFDNSNFQGTFPVASCVVFRDGKPSKSEYRKFNIKTVVGPDDFASMREIIHRRYSRLLEENKELPDLIIVDGGKGQLSSAYAVLQELGIDDRVPIVGLAKRLEEVYYPNDPEPYYLSRTGEPLKVICHLRDEAHRFGITFHRNKRSKGFITTDLDGIKGLGEKSITALFKTFRTMSKIRGASPEDLAVVIGQNRAERVFEALHRK